MPKVGKKHFAYTEKGVAAAKKHAKKTGKTVTHGRPKSATKRDY